MFPLFPCPLFVRFLFMGLFDALSGICMLFGGIHTSGSFQALLLNAVIPFTMVCRSGQREHTHIWWAEY